MKNKQIFNLEWDNYLDLSPYKTFFHRSFWLESTKKFFGKSLELYLFEQGTRKWLVPVFFHPEKPKEFSLNWIGYGGPIPLFHLENIIEEKKQIELIIKALEEQTEKNCSSFSTFPDDLWLKAELKNSDYLTYTHMLKIKEKESKAIFDHMISGNVRTSIRRAEKNLVTTSPLEKKDLHLAYHLLCETQARAGATYTTPKSFFDHLFMSYKQGVEFWGAFDRSHHLIAMSIVLFDDKTGIHYVHGWDREKAVNGANQALIWAMICSGIKKNIEFFNFGESHQDSLKIAKSRWGALTVPIYKGVGI